MQEVTLHLEQNTDFHIKEAFKTLRSNVEFCGSDVKVVAVTSCTPHEGKTSVAMEMAKAFAEAGNKTLLIDADMRKSVLVGRYKTGAVKYGLSHCLVGKYRYSDAMCQTNISRLYMFFSGPVPPNPSELLGSDRFVDMLNVMRTAFDYIIIDTPPLGSVIDAAVVAKRCDGTVLVVESNAVNYRFVQKVKEQLDKSGSRILGVVLNKVDLNKKGYYGHYGKYYGKYYGRYGNDADARPASPSSHKPETVERAERVTRPEMTDRPDRIRHLGETEKKNGKRKAVTAAAILILLVGLLFGGFGIVRAIGRNHLYQKASAQQPVLQAALGEEALTVEEGEKWQDGWVKYQDTVYAYKEEILTFLIMGIDKLSDAGEVTEGTDGGQADALFLAVLDPQEKRMKVIGINRNTMTDIDIYDENGEYVSTVKSQLAIQHGFGNGMEESCEYQKKAVENLFYQLPIHGYAAVNMSAIATINDAVGGVEVTVPADLDGFGEMFIEGEQVHLLGENAFWFVKYRDTDVFGSADLRLDRQKHYLKGFIEAAKQAVHKDASVVIDLYQAVKPQMVTDISLDEAAYLAPILADYSFGAEDFHMLPGETVMGEKFEEFYADEDAMFEMILDIFYEKYNDSRQRKNPIGRLAAFLVAMAVLTGCGAEKPDGAAQEEETELKAEPAAEVQSGGFAGESARDAQIDFAALQAENPDIFAWLYIPDTAIDCPVLQSGQADDFYESHDAYGEADEDGAVYIELANLTNMCDFNTVLHGRTGAEEKGSFADLYRFADADFFREHEKAYLYLDGNVLTYEIFAAYERENTSLLRSYDFTYIEGCEQFLKDLYATREMTMNLREGWEGVTPYHFLITLTTQKEENADRQFVVVAIMTEDAAGTIDRIVAE